MRIFFIQLAVMVFLFSACGGKKNSDFSGHYKTFICNKVSVTNDKSFLVLDPFEVDLKKGEDGKYRGNAQFALTNTNSFAGRSYFSKDTLSFKILRMDIKGDTLWLSMKSNGPQLMAFSVYVTREGDQNFMSISGTYKPGANSYYKANPFFVNQAGKLDKYSLAGNDASGIVNQFYAGQVNSLHEALNQETLSDKKKKEIAKSIEHLRKNYLQPEN